MLLRTFDVIFFYKKMDQKTVNKLTSYVMLVKTFDVIFFYKKWTEKR